MSSTESRPATRAGLIVNPLSGRGSGKGLALAEQLRSDRHVTVRVLDRFDQLGRFILDMADDGVSDLFISSGDGTTQEILTQIAEQRPFRHLPRIGLVPHGTTNLTAADLGLRRRSIAAQAEFIRTLKPAVIKARHTVRCANPRDGRPRHGMFVGTGAVAMATRYCQQAFNDRGVKGQWATFATLAGAIARTLFSRPDPGDDARFDRPFPITVRANERTYASGPQLLQMSTTLDKLILGARPFWGGRTGPIRTSVFPYPVPSVLRWLVPMMYGGENRSAPPGAVSFCSNALDVTSEVMFVIDGEFFDPPTDAPLRLETGPVFRFVCG
jgi:diacylglycerol kinase (ATP)